VRLADGAELHTDHVWSTLPLPALAHLVEPAPPPEVRAAAGGLTHRALVLVYLVLERRPYTPFDTHYFPALDVSLSRLSEPVNFRDGPDPSDRTVLCAEVPCAVGDESWECNAAEHGAEVAAALERQGLPAPAAIEVEVRRLPRVYPVYRPGFETAAATLERWSTGAGVRTFGRQGLFVPDNTHHALAMGWAIGDALGLDGKFDERRWADARERFRDNVVED
jgi:protoporphyrinogen oxidase